MLSIHYDWHLHATLIRFISAGVVFLPTKCLILTKTRTISVCLRQKIKKSLNKVRKLEAWRCWQPAGWPLTSLAKPAGQSGWVGGGLKRSHWGRWAVFKVKAAFRSRTSIYCRTEPPQSGRAKLRGNKRETYLQMQIKQTNNMEREMCRGRRVN